MLIKITTLLLLICCTTALAMEGEKEDDLTELQQIVAEYYADLERNREQESNPDLDRAQQQIPHDIMHPVVHMELQDDELPNRSNLLPYKTYFTYTVIATCITICCILGYKIYKKNKQLEQPQKDAS